MQSIENLVNPMCDRLLSLLISVLLWIWWVLFLLALLKGFKLNLS